MIKDVRIMKKIALSLTLFLSIFVLYACSSEIEVTFEVDGDVHDVRTIEEAGTIGQPVPKISGKHFMGWFLDESFEDPFDNDYLVEEDMTVYGKTIEHASYDETPIADQIRLDSSEYEGKQFPDDGIGEVTYEGCIDGDTTRFAPFQGGQVFSARYLFIDAPEATSTIEPWGPYATEYVCDILEAADTIVLEYEPHPEEGHPTAHPSIGRTGTFGRDLVTVWADGRNLNLELVELGLSYTSGTTNSKFSEYYQLAQSNADANARRMWGQDDPLFTADPTEVTLNDLIESPDEYLHTFVEVEGTLTYSGGDYYLCDEGESLYIYGIPTSAQNSIVNNIGAHVKFHQIFFNEYFGSLQFSGFVFDNYQVLDHESSDDACLID